MLTSWSVESFKYVEEKKKNPCNADEALEQDGRNQTCDSCWQRRWNSNARALEAMIKNKAGRKQKEKE